MFSESDWSSATESNFSYSPRSSNPSSIGDSNGNPKLRITKQPDKYHIFRYATEKRFSKTSVTLELQNSDVGQATIVGHLVHYDSDKIHTHWLKMGKQERSISQVIPQSQTSVSFNNISVLRPTDKAVKKFMKENKDTDSCYTDTKNKNIVRIKFTAYDENGTEICDPVISKPIYNNKSPKTNRLSITHTSLHKGNPEGGDEVYCLVDKVCKGDILISLFEYKDDGSVDWMESVKPSYIHHQCGIVFKTPPYKNKHLAQERLVWMQLFRPSDNNTSAKVAFTYSSKQQLQKDDLNCGVSSSTGLLKSPETTPASVLEDTIAEQKSISLEITNGVTESLQPVMGLHETYINEELEDWCQKLLQHKELCQVVDMVINEENLAQEQEEPKTENSTYLQDSDRFSNMVPDSGTTKVNTRNRDKVNSFSELQSNHNSAANDTTKPSVQNCIEDGKNKLENNGITNSEHVQPHVRNESTNTTNHEFDSGIHSPIGEFDVTDSAHEDESPDNNSNENEVLEDKKKSSVDKLVDVEHERHSVDIESTAVDDESTEQANLPDLVKVIKQENELEDNTKVNSSSKLKNVDYEVGEGYLSTKSLFRVLQLLLLLQVIYLL